MTENQADAASRALVKELARSGVRSADASSLRRALYSSDASLYRVVPTAVCYPRHVDELVAAVDVCRRLGMPLTMRGAGTSIAGNAVGTGLVVDVSRHLNRIRAIDVQAAEADVEPGVVQAHLQRSAAPYGLRFGPDPSTHNRCTIGGMIGNNACGSRALAYGRTSDNVISLDVLTGTGERLILGRPEHGQSPLSSPSEVLTALRSLIAEHLETIRTEFGQFSRQSSGYSLEHLLPEHRFDVARALVGSEGTLGVVLGAHVRLVTEPAAKGLVVLGYPSMAAAADAVPRVLPHHPTACEGLDSRIVDGLRRRQGAARVPPLPGGSGWLFVEVSGDTQGDVSAAAARVVVDSDPVDSMIVTDPAHATALWRIREDGAGLASRTPAGQPAHAGWEDAAVPPARLGDYLRDFDALLEQYGLSGFPYGHFGDGCIHVRLDFPLTKPGGTTSFRAFLLDAADLVSHYGGSMSGEHGDGRARSELLPKMYSPMAIQLFENVKAIFDPANILNPGVLVNPRPLDHDIRIAHARPLTKALALAYHDDGGDFSSAVHRCTGVGKCRADTAKAGGVMCPSYLATRDEKDSTRGRARVLQEMVSGALVSGGWRSPEVRDALDLCLSCKGCAGDCPTGVDMAAYKSEVTYQSYRHRLRPRSHYTLGWLPAWARMAAKAPRLANRAMAAPGVGSLGKWAAGVHQQRSLPSFAPSTFRQWHYRHRSSQPTGRPVLLWVDTFTDYFTPEIGISAVRVLEKAGYAVAIPSKPVCCGLTWISTGQLDTARRVLRRSLSILNESADPDTPVLGLEPSCTAVLRHDSVDLISSPEARLLANRAVTLAELLTRTAGWSPPGLSGESVVAQPHCHHAAVLGWDADASLLQRAGATVTRVGGCCGLAGNWGVERDHHDVSVAIARQTLLPAVLDAPAGTRVLADGFSCRTQLADLAQTPAMHLAQLLDRDS